jgi:hypothetical protein
VAAWLRRFGLHLAAAVGATGVFVAAAAVGASQTRQQGPPAPVVTVVRTRTPAARPKPEVVAPSATPAATGTPSPARVRTPAVRPERSLAGTIQDVQPNGVDVLGVGGREWHIEPAPGALIRRNGKAAKLESLQPGDGVVILGQAQPGPGSRFLAHAITAKSK